MEMDYYKVLGIEKTAKEDDIKKAYRKMALQWHPDKNPDDKEEAERRFKEISEAYQVLSDVDKRNAYDLYGKSGAAFASGAQSHFHFQSPNDLFQQFFGGVDPMSFLFGHHSSSNGNFNRNSNRMFQSEPIRVFTFSDTSGFMFRMGGGRYNDTFSNSVNIGSSPFHSRVSYEDNFYQELRHHHCPYELGTSKMSQSSVNIINGQRVVTTIEVDGFNEIITVETDGIITSRTFNGVEQNIPPSLSRSTASRTSRSHGTTGHSSQRMPYNGTSGSSGGFRSSFPNSASNSFIFKDSENRSTYGNNTGSGPRVPSTTVRLERKDVPVRKEAPVVKEVPLQKEAPTGKKVPEQKYVPARKDIPVQKEVPKGKNVLQIPNLLGQQGKDVPNSTSFLGCRLAPVRNELAEEQKETSVKGVLPPPNCSSEGSILSSNSNRKTLIYSRVTGHTPIRNFSGVSLV